MRTNKNSWTTELYPKNRKIYAKATDFFAWLWQVVTVFLLAMLGAMVASLLLNLLVDGTSNLKISDVLYAGFGFTLVLWGLLGLILIWKIIFD